MSRPRLLAAFGVGLVFAATWVVSTDSVFAIDPTEVTIVGASYADTEAIRQDLGLDGGTGGIAQEHNVFRLTTAEMERRIETLPSVLSANVDASLPNQLVVRIHERQPILVWHTGDASWLVDVNGFVIAAADPQQHPDVAALPVIQDVRSVSKPLAAGASLDPLDIAVARLLGGLTADTLGSSATSVTVTLDDEDGWVIQAAEGWRAVFGHFTSELHTPADIPRQVQCLVSLLADREPQLETVTLAVAADGCGTFTKSAGAHPGSEPSASPGKRPHAGQSADPTKPPKATPTPTPKPGKHKPPKSEASPTPRPSR